MFSPVRRFLLLLDYDCPGLQDAPHDMAWRNRPSHDALAATFDPVDGSGLLNMK
jgi:hypothetical protein